MGLSIKPQSDGSVTVECGGDSVIVKASDRGTVIVTTGGLGMSGPASSSGGSRNLTPTRGGVSVSIVNRPKPRPLEAKILVAADTDEIVHLVTDMVVQKKPKRLLQCTFKVSDEASLDVSDILARVDEARIVHASRASVVLDIYRTRG